MKPTREAGDAALLGDVAGQPAGLEAGAPFLGFLFFDLEAV